MPNNVTAAKPPVGGSISVAPLGTTLPTDATTALANTFKKLGYISDSGLVNSTSMESASVNAWGGDEVLDISQGRKETFKYTLLEALNVEVLKQVYGAENVTGSGASDTNGIKITSKSNLDLPEQVVVADMILKGGILKRIVIPAGKVTAVGDIIYSDSNAVGYETTLKALSDANGNAHYEYIKAPASSSSNG